MPNIYFKLVLIIELQDFPESSFDISFWKFIHQKKNSNFLAHWEKPFLTQRNFIRRFKVNIHIKAKSLNLNWMDIDDWCLFWNILNRLILCLKMYLELKLRGLAWRQSGWVNTLCFSSLGLAGLSPRRGHTRNSSSHAVAASHIRNRGRLAQILAKGQSALSKIKLKLKLSLLLTFFGERDIVFQFLGAKSIDIHYFGLYGTGKESSGLKTREAFMGFLLWGWRCPHFLFSHWKVNKLLRANLNFSILQRNQWALVELVDDNACVWESSLVARTASRVCLQPACHFCALVERPTKAPCSAPFCILIISCHLHIIPVYIFTHF